MTDKHFMQAKTEEVIKKKKQDNKPETDTTQFDQGPTSEAVQRALANPSSANLTPAVMTSLQRSHGNQFVAQLARQQNASKLSAPIQMKMSVTAADDQYEQEADTMAQNAMQQINSGEVQRMGEEEEEAMQMKRIQREGEEEELMMKRIQRSAVAYAEEEVAAPAGGEAMGHELAHTVDQGNAEEEEVQAKRIQRMGEEEEEAMQMKRIQREGEEEELMMKRIQRQSSEDGFDVNDDIENRIESSRGGGQALDEGTRSNMEGAFGADFSNVRVHTGSEAADLSSSVQAKAFTTGSDIYFNEGEYNPGSSQGQELLAHELTHTIQQGAVAQTKRKEKDD